VFNKAKSADLREKTDALNIFNLTISQGKAWESEQPSSDPREDTDTFNNFSRQAPEGDVGIRTTISAQEQTRQTEQPSSSNHLL
jgi:hypothetical protein